MNKMTVFGERSLIMRRAVIILILIAIAFGVGFLTFFLYNVRTEVLGSDEMTCADCVIRPTEALRASSFAKKRDGR